MHTLRTIQAGFLLTVTLLFASTVSAQPSEPFLQTTTEFSENRINDADTLVLLVPAEQDAIRLTDWSGQTSNHIARAVAAKEFEAGQGQKLEILAPTGLSVDRMILLGLGEVDELSRHDAELIGADLANHINASAAQRVEVNAELIDDASRNAGISTAIAHGMDLRNYRFDRHFSDPEPRPSQHYHFTVDSQSVAEEQYSALRAMAEGVFHARELANLPGSDGYPAAFAEYVREVLEPLGVTVTILGPEEVLEAGMGALYGVSQGSQHKAHLVIAHWEGSDDQPISLVGKGNTFDTGGYNLKTNAASILQMQTDKSGAAAVAGAMVSLATQRVPANVVGVMPLSQNAISGEAQLPGDVVTAGDGTTIEVANTDAEGRLILADAIWYTREHHDPRIIVDIATLTGAKRTALGGDYAAVFTDQEDLLASMRESGELTGELVWRMPLGPYKGIIDSRIADIRNTGSPGAQAGAIFLQHFAADTPWLHLDIAGNAFFESANGVNPPGATGFGARLLSEWVKIHDGQ